MRSISIASALALALLGGCRDSVANFADALVAADDAAADDAALLDDAASTSDAGGASDAVPGVDAVGPRPDAGAPMDAAGVPDASGTGLEPGPGDLVFVELQGNPQGASDEQAEYVELINVSGRALDLSGCRLTHREWMGGMAPVMSVGNHRITGSVSVAAGDRVLLTRSNGGYFGGAMRDEVYGALVLANGASDNNRLRLMAPGWDGREPPDPSFVVDELLVPAGTFDNALRGRAWQLDPARATTAAENDDPTAWCHAASDNALAYWMNNWGTPRAANVCP